MTSLLSKTGEFSRRKQVTGTNCSVFHLLSLLLVFCVGFWMAQMEYFSSRAVSCVDSPFQAVQLFEAKEQVTSAVNVTLAREALEDLKRHLRMRGFRADEKYFHATMPLLGGDADLALARTYARRIVRGQDLVVGVAGSSNSACHDSTVEECYPTFFANDLRGVLSNLNISVELRNHGMGATDSLFWSLCSDTMLGDDVDVLLIEFMMNDAGMHCSPVTLEMVLRRGVTQVAHQAVPHFVWIEGGRRPTDENANTYDFEPHTTDRESHAGNGEPVWETARHYKRLGGHVMFMIDGLWTLDKEEGFRYKDLFASFHPGPPGHRYLADQLLYYHTAAIEQALALIEVMSIADLADAARVPVPEPLYCGDWCQDEAMANCYTSFQPRQRFEMSVAAAMRLNPLPPIVRNATEALAEAAELSKDVVEWHRVLAEGENLHPERDYQDYKMLWMAREGAGPRTFVVQVPASKLGSIIVCEHPHYWSTPREGWGRVGDPAFAKVLLDGDVVTGRPKSEEPEGINLDGWKRRHGELLASPNTCDWNFYAQCTQFGQHLSPGEHRLEITPVSVTPIGIHAVIGV